MTLYRKITLISFTDSGTDTIGQPIVTEKTREVLAEYQSVTSNEYFAGKQGGLSPSFRFRLDKFAYKGEKLVVFAGTRYSIYKTYEADNNYIDLYVEEELGETNNV